MEYKKLLEKTLSNCREPAGRLYDNWLSNGAAFYGLVLAWAGPFLLLK